MAVAEKKSSQEKRESNRKRTDYSATIPSRFFFFSYIIDSPYIRNIREGLGSQT
tara:strand:- start:59 stop:220 length:162 start_codon:yes stop_codon:yes gene_type:complete